MYCTNCGAKIDDDATFCTSCGARVEKDEPSTQDEPATAGPQPGTCPHCGAPVEEGASFCTSCGASLRSNGTPSQPGAGSVATKAPVAPIPSPPQAEPPEREHRKGGGARVAAVCIGAVAIVAIGALALWVGGIGPFATGDAAQVANANANVAGSGTTNVSNSSTGTAGAGSSAANSTSGSTSSTSSSSSTTTANVSVPDLTGMAQADATQRLQGAGLVLGTVTDDYSDTVPSGSVISQSVSAGSAVASGASVDLVVSKGPRRSHTYTLVQQAMTWNEAKSYCESHGGHLATISDASEYQKVLDAMSGTNVHVCWVGGYRDGSTWKWITGETFSYTAWASGEPNNDGGVENYLALLKTPSDEWGWYDCPNDVSGTYKSKYLGFVMEQDS